MAYRAWKDLSAYEGREIKFHRGLSHLTELEETRVPDRCVFLKDYEKTVLIDMIYINWGKETHIKRMFPKAALATGDVLLEADRMLVGHMIGELA